MLETLQEWCEYIFPERKDHRVVKSLTEGDLFLHFEPKELDGCIYLLPFKVPTVRAVIHEAKFYGNEHAFNLLAVVLGEYLKPINFENVIIAIPLSDKRRKERGYNQVEEVVKRVAGITRERNVLFRLRDTKPQASLKRKERLTNMVDAFGIRRGELIKDRHVILVDDVLTTGATLRSAAEALRAFSPASLTLLALAH